MNYEELRAKAQAATPGPWRCFAGNHDASISIPEVDVVELSDPYVDTPVDQDFSSRIFKSNADYIAAANPQTVLALLDRLEELESLLSETGVIAAKYVGRDWRGNKPWSDADLATLNRARSVLGEDAECR